MSVASHLAIDVAEYDARIRTFIPDYEDMLDAAARVAAAARPRTLVDIGTGSGALADRVARRQRQVKVIGIDADAGMLAMAARRLPRTRTRLICSDFLTTPIPTCHAVTASFALHHVASPRAKRAFYTRVRHALRGNAVFVSADCHPAALPALASDGMQAWRQHLADAYGPRQADAFLETWSGEDFYTSLDHELALLHAAGFESDVVWRRGAFAVIAAQPRAGRGTGLTPRPAGGRRPGRGATATAR